MSDPERMSLTIRDLQERRTRCAARVGQLSGRKQLRAQADLDVLDACIALRQAQDAMDQASGAERVTRTTEWETRKAEVRALNQTSQGL